MDLHLQIDGDEIVVTRPGTDFELVYGRPRGERNLRLKRSWISRTDATPAVNEFRRAAQQAATAKARELGWNTVRNPAGVGEPGFPSLGGLTAGDLEELRPTQRPTRIQHAIGFSVAASAAAGGYGIRAAR